jgi:hypothetical protein
VKLLKITLVKLPGANVAVAMDNCTALKIAVMTKAKFITNFTYKVYNNTLTGGH